MKTSANLRWCTKNSAVRASGAAQVTRILLSWLTTIAHSHHGRLKLDRGGERSIESKISCGIFGCNDERLGEAKFTGFLNASDGPAKGASRKLIWSE